MEIVIFKELTTDSFICELEEEAKKYDGLYVDMEDAPQRKYVKDKAYDIQQLLKKIDRKRIDSASDYKKQVEKEASAIVERLKVANEPFTLLIDEHKAERAKIINAEKARKQAILDAEQFELDHEMGLLINKTYEFDKAEELRIQTESDDKIRKQATIDAEDRQRIQHEERTKKLVDEEKARLANKEHGAKVNNAILDVLMDNGIGIDNAKDMIKLAAKGLLPHLTINY